MINVLHVLTDSNIGGAGRYVEFYLRNYDKNNICPSLLIPKGSDVLSLVDDIGVNIIEADIAKDKSLDFKSIKTIKNIIKDGKYDIVHTHGSVSARIAAKGKSKNIFTKHTLSYISNPIIKLVGAIGYNLFADMAIAISKASFKNLKTLGMPDRKISLVYNGTENIGVPTDEQRIKAREKFGFDQSNFVIGMVARNEKCKDYPTFLKGCAFLESEDENLRFVICGGGSELENNINLSKELGIYEKCSFLGQVTNVKEVYHALDVFCLTSVEECFGLVISEAFSAGLPSVVTNIPGILEVAIDDKTSLVFDKGDYKKMAENVLLLYQDKKKYQYLREQSLLRYDENFRGDVFAKNIEDVYYKVLNK